MMPRSLGAITRLCVQTSYHDSALLGAGHPKLESDYDKGFISPALRSTTSSENMMLNDELKSRIQQAYRDLLAKQGFLPRSGQRQMIAEIARCLGSVETDKEGRRTGNAPICVLEAGTGTGKTLAYLLGALPLALAQDKTLVISTATVVLQEQLVNKDLPALIASCGMTFNFSLAKGRGRYICRSRLEQVLARHQGIDPDQALFEDERQDRLDEATVSLYEEWITELDSNSWDGERDSWPEVIAGDRWARVITDHKQCTNRRCSHFNECSYFIARQAVAEADVIVANHDLVLSDLTLGGGALLPAPESCIYVFDEAHHLADKAINHFGSRCRIEASKQWLQQLPRFFAQLAAVVDSASLNERQQQLPALLQSLDENFHFLLLQVEELLPDFDGEESQQYRFASGELTEEIRTLARNLAQGFSRVGLQLVWLRDALTDKIKNQLAEERQTSEGWLARVVQLESRAEQAQSLWQSYTFSGAGEQAPIARWIHRYEKRQGGDVEFFSSLVSAATVLDEGLWQRCHAAVLTSATMTVAHSFERMRKQLGLSAESRTTEIISPFRYQEVATLAIPVEAADPKLSQNFEQQLIAGLETHIDPAEATLVLFTSRYSLQQVLKGLKPELLALVLNQDDYSKQRLIERHKERVDRGEGSIIFGLASFAEGIDLPGDYLKHVVITKLPFAVPDDPVTATLHEWLAAHGQDPFREVTVPDAAIKLKQACGRLLRSESDSGRVTLLDRRIISKGYGRTLLASLPDYRQLRDSR